ncbi:MAG: MFS transporter [Micrococcales bacterium]|nr:MFS transporter [Micrococcales bacterium]
MADRSDHGELVHLKGGWIDGWDPENLDQWERGGGRLMARRNLGFSIYAEFLGFVVWQLWSIVVVWLDGWQGFSFDNNQQFWLISTPSLVGATLRFPYTFMVSKLGGRNWTIVSAGLLLVPTTAMGFAIANHPDANGQGGTSYGVMLLVAALAGFGGGNFASSMANITFFFPQRTKGWALGLNAAGGNIGAAMAQFTVPILVTVTAASVTAGTSPEARLLNLPLVGPFWIPFIIAAMVLAWFKMNNLTSAKADLSGYKAALGDPHLWLLSLLYIGTFGSFIGLAGAFPKLIADHFPDYRLIHFGYVGIGLAFLGPLVGSLARPFGGRLADKIGGAYITAGCFVVMILAVWASIKVLATPNPSFWVFLACFMVLFMATGVGNGSMYKMIPTVFAWRAGQADASNQSAGIPTERKTSAALGIVSAFGAYGGFLVPQVFNQALKLRADLPDQLKVVQGYSLGLWWLAGTYAVMLACLVALYIVPHQRRGSRV